MLRGILIDSAGYAEKVKHNAQHNNIEISDGIASYRATSVKKVVALFMSNFKRFRQNKSMSNVISYK